MVKLAELEPGDLVVTMINDTTAGHASIFTGTSDIGATIIHAVNDDKKNLHKLMVTGLQPRGKLLVFRCRNDKLSRRAVKYAQRWAQYETPYDSVRINLKQALMNQIALDGIGLDAVDRRIAIQRRFFEEQGTFRAIKYAARRKYALCLPGDDSSASNGRGLTCTMFAILCYQVAGLADYVDAHETPNPLHRVTDKKLDAGDLEMIDDVLSKGGFSKHDLIAYKEYSERLRSVNPYRINWDNVGRENMKAPGAYKTVTSFHCYPSITYWRDPRGRPISSFDFGAAFTEAMKLDAKIASPTDMMLSVRADEVGWKPLGLIEEEEAAIDPRQRDLYQQQLQQNALSATAKRLEVKQAIESRKLNPLLAWLTGVSHA
jgi:hypothetical protein